MLHTTELNTDKKLQNKIFPSTKIENSAPIPIQMNRNSVSYDLTNHIIDPTKFSPPNEFMNKLKMRMNVYNNVCVTRNVLIREIA